jgi:hypothetical protein
MASASGLKVTGMAIAAITMIASPVQAQNSSAGGQLINGQINERSPSSDGRRYQVRTMNFEAGKRYAINADSESFDPKLRVSFADDNDETLAEDDDGGEGTNAYLEFTPNRSGQHRLRVTNLGEDGGSFTIRVRSLPPLPALLRPSPVGTSSISFKHYANELSASDGVVRGRRVDDYQFAFTAGKQVFIYMDRQADDIDPYLEVFADGNRNGSDALASDDDGGNERNAFVTFVPEKSGNYIVRATSVTDENVTGRYTLRVGQEP